MNNELYNPLEEKREEITLLIQKAINRLNIDAEEEQLASLTDILVRCENMEEVVEHITKCMVDIFQDPEQNENLLDSIQDVQMLDNKSNKTVDDILLEAKNKETTTEKLKSKLNNFNDIAER